MVYLKSISGSSGVPRDLIPITVQCWSLIFLSSAYLCLYSLTLRCTTHVPRCIHLHHFYVNTFLFSSLQVCSLFRMLYIPYFTEIPTLHFISLFNPVFSFVIYLPMYVSQNHLPQEKSTVHSKLIGLVEILFYIVLFTAEEPSSTLCKRKGKYAPGKVLDLQTSPHSF